MIRLSGLQVKSDQSPDGDVEIQFTGLRPGEKMYEELLIGKGVKETGHPRIMKATEDSLPLAEVERLLEKIERRITDLDSEGLRRLLCEGVKDYQPQCGLVDLTTSRTAQ